MADTVDIKYTSKGRYHQVRLQNRSDGTGESGVTKIDISTLLTPAGATCTWIVVDRIESTINGMTVRLDWDHTTDDELATLAPGGAPLDWSSVGGNPDPKSSGGTGDVLLTTIGHAAGSTYDITITFRCKA
jgi:hypothetical protein